MHSFVDDLMLTVVLLQRAFGGEQKNSMFLLWVVSKVLVNQVFVNDGFD